MKNSSTQQQNTFEHSLVFLPPVCTDTDTDTNNRVKSDYGIDFVSFESYCNIDYFFFAGCGL